MNHQAEREAFPPLPFPARGGMVADPMFTEDQMRAYVLADRAARASLGGAQVEPSPEMLQAGGRVFADMVGAPYNDWRHFTDEVRRIYRAMLAAAPEASPLPQGSQTDSEALWLWKNGDHFLAFRHLYPCFEPGGDPMVLGEPFGRAVLKVSFDRKERP